MSYLLDTNQASALDRWLRELKAAFAAQIMPATLEVARAWGSQRLARPVPVIGATARVHGLTVVTRDARAFERTGVQVLNPFG